MLLQDVTGQRSAIHCVLERQQSPRKECLIVSGPAGSGVTWTLNEIGIEWERRGGVALKATGAVVTSPRPLLPWLTITSPARRTLARWEVLKEVAAQASKVIPVIGQATSYLVKEALNYRRKKIARQTQVLGEKEQDLLFVIQTAAHGKRLLLLVDQLSNWDNESWGLLELIVSPFLQESYSSLTDLFIVIGVSEGVLPRCRILVDKLPFVERSLERLHREHLSLALETFDFTTLDDQEMNLLYEATDGRLDLLHDFRSLSRDLGVTKLIGEGNALYGRMIERRLRALKGDVRALDDLLTAGSFLGHSFSFEELCCLTDSQGDQLQTTLHFAEDEHLLGVTDSYVSFPSVAMQQYFRASRIGDAAKYHVKFAECLRKLRPADYEIRCEHLLLGGDTNGALICYCLASLDAHRNRRALPEVNGLRNLSDWHEFESYLEAMLAAYSAYDRDDIREGLSILQSLEVFIADVLAAERDYLEARFRLKSHRVSDFEAAVISLKRWLSLEDMEPEIWSRIGQTLIVGLIETGLHEEASKLEEALTKFYGARRKLDPWALYGLNCLRRRSECLYHLVPARSRLQNALAYFGPTTPGMLPRHFLQYYYTLTNLVSNLIAGGSFLEATSRGAELEALVERWRHFDWPSLEVPANNSILASYLSGVLPLVEATDLMRRIEDHQSESGDQILIRNNLAVLLIHGGQLVPAREILTAVLNQLDREGESDAYHRYFVTNNLAGLIAVAGSQDQATTMLAKAGRDLNRFYPAIRETITRRHAMIPEALAIAPALGPEKFDTFLTDRHSPQVGPQWAFYGRGFLLSDIQFWASD